MRLGLGIGAGALALTIAAVVSWHRCGDTAGPTDARGPTTGTRPNARDRSVDPRSEPRGSIAGTITNSAGEPIGGARVCADGSSTALPSLSTREPRCTFADDRGIYRLADLLPVRYRLSAVAPTYRPSTRDDIVELLAGENETGVDIVILRGGVEVTGTVSDLTGGPIAHAVVRGEHFELWTTVVETDEAGRFTLWATPGAIGVSAQADGYSGDWKLGNAPGTFDLVLTPESTIEGIVVDERTNQPIAGAHVDLRWSDSPYVPMGPGDAVSDEQGRFRIDRVAPGRYRVLAHGRRLLGGSVGSVGVGLGQHIDGVVVRTHAAPRLEGVVGVAGAPITTCIRPSITLDALDAERIIRATGTNGTIAIDGIPPGTYAVRHVDCVGFISLDKYPDVVIEDDDVTGLRWDVVPGASVRGRVIHRSGRPIEAAVVVMGGIRVISDREGRFEIGGVIPGSHTLYVETSHGVATPVEIAVDRGVVIAPDLIIDAGGRIEGLVVDADGRAVEQVEISGGNSSAHFFVAHSDTKGRFVFEPAQPGEYRLFVNRDDSYEYVRVTVRAGATAEARLVLASHYGVIKGTVRDRSGKAISDAFVVAGSEEHSEPGGAATRWVQRRPVVTDLDGAFVITKLAAGAHSVRAFRPGGGEAIADNVPVGSKVDLVIASTGTIDGVVRVTPPVDDIRVTLFNVRTRLSRSEQFVRTGGRYELRDLPSGRYRITARAALRAGQVEVELIEGGTATAPVIDLDAGVTVTGRVIDIETKQPVAGIDIALTVDDGSGNTNRTNRTQTGPAGRFALEHVPNALVDIVGGDRDGKFRCIRIEQAIVGRDSVDVGDITAVRSRVPRGAKGGDLGIKWHGLTVVRAIDRAGPASKTELRVGDHVTTIDGVEIRDFCVWNALIGVPPGTSIRLGLERGVVVTVVAQ